MDDNRTHILDSIRELQRLADLFALRREQLARSAGLSVQQWRVLEEISDQHFMPSMFARQQESSAAAVSKIIRQLLDKGFIDVAVDEADLRVRRYSLTPEGTAVMGRLREQREDAIQAIWGGMSVDRLTEFRQFASELGDRMESYSRDVRELTTV